MNDVVSRLYHIRKTVVKMLDDRGYLLPKEELEFTLDNFKQRFSFTEANLTPGEPPKYDYYVMISSLDIFCHLLR
jgi:hypothetical protein